MPQQALQQRLVLVELDSNRNALDDFGEIAGALSGGSSANCEPLAGAIRSTRPRNFPSGSCRR